MIILIISEAKVWHKYLLRVNNRNNKPKNDQKNQSMDLFIFPCSTLWTMTFVSETLDKVSKLASKICNFPNFHFFENLQKVKPIIQKSV